MSILSLNSSALHAIAKRREQKERVVFTNGCFDLLHVGHLRYLREAKSLGDILVLGLNSDSSVRRLKGPKRPIVCEEERREMLLGLVPVDYVCLFDEDTPLNLIKSICPDILVKGGDWSVKEIVGSDFVLARGGEVRSLQFVNGKSSSDLVARIIERYKTV